MDAPTTQERNNLIFYGSQTLAPQAHAVVHTDSIDPQFTQTVAATLAAHWAAIDSSTEILYIYGEWKYVDVSNRHHTTTFCENLVKMHQTPPKWGLSTCNGFNEMN
jgi:hypothetical protein